MKPRNCFIGWVALAAWLLLAIYAFGDQSRQIAMALALAQSQSEQSVVSEKANETPTKPLTTATGQGIDATRRAAAQEVRQSQVLFIPWTKAEKDDKPTLYYFHLPTCAYCPEQLKRLSDPSVLQAMRGWSAVSLGPAGAQMWHVGEFPTIILTDVSQKRRVKLTGLQSVDQLREAIETFGKKKTAKNTNDGAYYPARRISWLLNGQWVSHDHLLNHFMHRGDNLDPQWVRSLDVREVQYVHQDSHNHSFDSRYVRRK